MNHMIKYIIRRLVQAIPTFIGITILSYLLMSLSPGGAIRLLTFGDTRLRPEEREAIEARLGFNDPIFVQYLRWFLGDHWMRWDANSDGVSDGSFLVPLDADGDGAPEPPGVGRGVILLDFGSSLTRGRRDALSVIAERIPATLELGVASLLVGLVVGLPIGILAAVWRGSFFDNFTRIFATFSTAIPIFWFGFMLILLFGVTIKGPDGQGLLPMGSRCPTSLTGGCAPLHERLEYLILPTLALAVGAVAGFSRYMRASMLDVINQDYMRTARSKGLNNRVVWFKHGARNALIPIATFLGPALTGLLSGAAITENVFSWPGLGRLAVESVTAKDYPIVMAVVIITSIATILGFILSDILYALIDPRIRFS
jgi:peptide/nickel transport system permease protein